MRIVYTNLKEDDAGVKRSVRQFQVDFNGTGARSALVMPLATPIVAVPDEKLDADRLLRAATPDAEDVVYRHEVTPPAENSGGFRRILIKKFVDTQRTLLSGRKGGLSITI